MAASERKAEIVRMRTNGYNFNWDDLTAIIPAYRCANFLPAAVQSLLQCPISIIITEDCGGDDTLPVAEDLQRRFPNRITVLHNENNLGVSQTINRTLEYVHTKHVLKMDADDVIFPEYVRRAYDYLSGHDELALICGTCKDIGPYDYLSIEEEPKPRESLDGPIHVMAGSDACRFILRWDPYPCSSGIIYRTEALKSVGGFAPAVKWAEDREIWFRLARRWPVAYYDVPGTLYRRHPGSVTALNRSQYVTAVEDGHLIARSRRLWPERNLLPDFARSFYEISRDCGRSAKQAMRSGSWESGIQCSASAIRYLGYASLLSLLSFSIPRRRHRTGQLVVSQCSQAAQPD